MRRLAHGVLDNNNSPDYIDKSVCVSVCVCVYLSKARLLTGGTEIFALQEHGDLVQLLDDLRMLLQLLQDRVGFGRLACSGEPARRAVQ